jgi:hypothetical protein
VISLEESNGNNIEKRGRRQSEQEWERKDKKERTRFLPPQSCGEAGELI